MTRQFGAAAREAAKTQTEVDEGFPFDVVNLDGSIEKCVAHRPNPAQFAVLMSQIGRYTNLQTQTAGVIDFFVGVMDEHSQVYLIRRLLDAKDPFGLEEVQDITEWLVEEWTARPTQQPSDSTQSQRTDGSSSTLSTTASI